MTNPWEEDWGYSEEESAPWEQDWYADEEDELLSSLDVSDVREEPDRRSKIGIAKDIGITSLKGAIGVGEAIQGLLDIPTGGRVGRFTERLGYRPKEAKEILSDFYSPEQKEAFHKVGEAEGFVDTLKAAVESPSTIGHAALESLPLMGAGGVIGRGAMAVAPKIPGMVAGALGEGAIGAGISASEMREEGGTLSPEQSALALGSGIGTGAFALVGGGLAKKLGFADVDTMLASGVGTGKKSLKDVAKGIVGGGISEGIFEELPQSVQERVWLNAATDKPLLEGTGEEGAMGMLAGGLMGSGANVLNVFASELKEKAGEKAANLRAQVEESESSPISTVDQVIAEEETKKEADTLEQLAELPVQEQTFTMHDVQRENAKVRGIGDWLEARLGDTGKEELFNDFVEQGEEEIRQGSVRERRAAFKKLQEELRAKNLAEFEQNMVGRVTPETSELAKQTEPTEEQKRAERIGGIREAFEDAMPEQYKTAVNEMERQLTEGETGSRFQKDDGTWDGVKTTNPEFIQLKTLKEYDRKNGTSLAGTLNKKSFGKVVDKVRKGQRLSSKQQEIWEYIQQASKSVATIDEDYNKAIAEVGELSAPQRIPVGEIEPGEKVVVDRFGSPDVVEHKGFDEKGNAILEDGSTIVADVFDQIEILGRKKGTKAEHLAEKIGKKDYSFGEGNNTEEKKINQLATDVVEKPIELSNSLLDRVEKNIAKGNIARAKELLAEVNKVVENAADKGETMISADGPVTEQAVDRSMQESEYGKVRKRIAELSGRIEPQEATDDSQKEGRIPRSVGEGEEPGRAIPEQEGGTGQAEAGGISQAAEEKIAALQREHPVPDISTLEKQLATATTVKEKRELRKRIKAAKEGAQEAKGEPEKPAQEAQPEKQGEKVEAEQPPKLSQTTPTSASTVSQVRTALTTGLRGRKVRRLIEEGKLRIVQSVKELPEGGKFMVAWHGSPYKFDKFSTEKIGTGEGAQAYGYGLYFASRKEVADWYKEKLAVPVFSSLTDKVKAITIDGESLLEKYDVETEEWMWQDAKKGDVELFLQDSRDSSARWRELENDETYPYRDYAKKKAEGHEALQKALEDGATLGYPTGTTYQVELAPAPEDYLLWDKPLSEQSEKVKAALAPARKDERFDLSPEDGTDIESSETAYARISDALGSDKAASDYLHSLGIRGIKYLDGTSRAKGEGAYNYVIFSDEDVEITGKYSQQKGINGAYYTTQDRIYLVADNITPGTETETLLHEGFHREVERMNAGKNPALQKIMDSLAALEERKSTEEWFTKARKAAQVAKDSPHYIEEIGAYAVTQYTAGEKQPFSIRRWVKKLLAYVKVALLERYGIMGKLDDAMLARIAERGLRVAPVKEEGLAAGGEPVYSQAEIMKHAKAFYSKLQQVAADKFQGMKAQSVLPFLQKQGVKKDEIEATGVKEWLAAKKPTDKVTQQELSDFVRANMVEIEDVVLGEGLEPLNKNEERIYRQLEAMRRANAFTMPGQEEQLQELAARRSAYKDVVHFPQYQEPGAEEGSYREMFVTAPQVFVPRSEQINLTDNISFEWFGVPLSKLTAEQKERIQRESKEWEDGHSQYSDIKNPIVRIRFNTRTDSQGRRILFVEEMQGPSKDNQAKMPAYLRDNLYNLGVKRILAYAKENGFDGVSWTTGEMQGDRYSLSKQVDTVHWEPGFYTDGGRLTATKDGKEVISEGTQEEKLADFIGKDAAQKLLSSEPEQTRMGEVYTLSGQDLDVGNRGLRQLYNTTLPKMFEAYAKGKVGEAKIQTTEAGENEGYKVILPEGTLNFSTREEAERIAAQEGGEVRPIWERRAVPFIPLTNAPESFPIFSQGKPIQRVTKAMLDTPAFKKWFGNSIFRTESGEPVPLWHGTSDKNFLQTDWIFAKEKGKGKHHSPLAGLGNFFALDRTEAVGYTKGEGAVRPFYVAVQNPLIVNSWELNHLNTREEAEAFAKRMELRGHDGVYFPDQGHVVVFDGGNIKSAEFQTGEWDRGNRDVRYSISQSIDENGKKKGKKLSTRKYTPEQEAAIRKGGFGIREVETVSDKINRVKLRAAAKLRQGLIDQYDSFKRILNDPTAWMMAQLTKSDTGALWATIRYGMPKLDESGAIDLVPNSKSLQETLTPLGDEIDDFFRWIAGHRADRLMPEDREHLFTQDEIDALKTLNQGKMADGRSREEVYNSVYRDFSKINNAVAKIAVQTGLINAEEALRWKQEGFYIPFYRMLDDSGRRGPSNLSALVKQKGYVKLKGSTKQIDDPLTNILLNWNHLIAAGLRNQAGAKALDSAVKMGIAFEVEKQDAGKKAVYIREDGKEKWYELDETQDGALVLDSLMSLNYEGLNNPAMKALRKFKRILTYGVTAGPGFKIRNLIRDTIHASAVTNASPNMVKNLYAGFTSKNLKRMEAGGGAFGMSGYIHGADPDAIKKLTEIGVERDAILDTVGRIKKMWEKYQDFGAYLENVNRIAGFEEDLKKGKSLLEANFNARDQLDFSRTGSFVFIRILSQTVPFLNARLQGLDKLGRAGMDDNQRKQFFTVAGAYTLASVLLYMAMAYDDDYDEAEEWEKRTYHLFKIPGSEMMYRIPRPFEIGAIAYMAEKMTEQFIDGTAKVKDLRFALYHTINDTFSFNPIPQAFKPMIEVYANKNMFTGRAIESMSMRNLSKTNRYEPWTSYTARGVSKALATVTPEAATLSPLQIQHMVRGYTGWLGSTILAGIDGAIGFASGEIKPSTRWYEYDPIKSLVRGEAKSTKYMTQFYDNLEELTLLYGDIKKYKGARGLTFDERNKLRHRKLYNKKQRELSALRKKMRAVYSSSMSGEKKRERIARINERMNEIAKKVVIVSESAF